MISESNAFARYCEYRYEPASLAEIGALEARLNVSLPEDLRQSLLKFNGGEFEGLDIATPVRAAGADELRSLYGVRMGTSSDMIEYLGDASHLALFDDNDPIVVLPIGATLLGDLLLLRFRAGQPSDVLVKKAWDPDGFAFLCECYADLFSLLTPAIP